MPLAVQSQRLSSVCASARSGLPLVSSASTASIHFPAGEERL